MVSRDRLVVRTLRCGRSNPGSNPGPGMSFFKLLSFIFILPRCRKIFSLEIFSSYNYEVLETSRKYIILRRILTKRINALAIKSRVH